ncbi:MAG TPA: alpha/beta hydrolase [Thermoanaerobaculia bacterium]|nr:alpha/beta hydrolase [Thermoanaerobaculia bacterium]
MANLSEPTHFSVREDGNRKGLVLIHGFHGDAHQTFGMLPAFLAGTRRLYDWDIHCFGYPTGLAPDLAGVWAADPDLTLLAGYLDRKLALPPFKGYDALALIAHSMGGLIVQRGLLDGSFAPRTQQVLLFGTPSAGLRKARLGQWIKRQARDMVAGGEFITKLRADWTKRYGAGGPSGFCTVAGLRDDFVRAESSQEPFSASCRDYVAGNHLEMVKPRDAGADITILLIERLGGELAGRAAIRSTAPGAAPLPLRLERYARVIEELQMKAASQGYHVLNDEQVVDLALALEMTGRQAEAITILESVHTRSSELTGVLAGRRKRLWLADPEGSKSDGESAYTLYLAAFERAKSEKRPQQAFYNGINVAFLTLTLREDEPGAATTAEEVLAYCSLGPPSDKWRLATEGEAHLYLRHQAQALARYAAALATEPDPREVDSMHQQALFVVRALGDEPTEVALRSLFGGA